MPDQSKNALIKLNERSRKLKSFFTMSLQKSAFLLQTVTVISIISILSCILFVKIVEGQEDVIPEDTEWPTVADPFPESDDIGPEPEPTPAPPPDCTQVCQDNILATNTRIDNLQLQVDTVNTTLSDRISALNFGGGGGGGGNNDAINQHLLDIESYIAGNTTNLMTKIDTDVAALRTQLTDDISALRQELETKINAIPAGSGGGSDGAVKAIEVYYNLTQRINTLERGKVQTLMLDNNLWRKNFRVINATFAKLRKSSRGNNVVLNG